MAVAERQVAIIGGGLAGLAAAVALAGRGAAVTLLEAKQKLGGRAGSFVDPESGETVDQCQHVTLGCCTNFANFCERSGIGNLLTRHDTLHFFGPDDRHNDFCATRWLPPPLHLAPAFMRLKYLSWGDKWRIAWGMLRLMRTPAKSHASDEPTIGEWLQRIGQSDAAIRDYWKVVLESALGESLDRASYSAARKVFVDGFLAHRDAYVMSTPGTTLHELYDVHVANWLKDKNVRVRRGQAVSRLDFSSQGVAGIELANGERVAANDVIVALPWKRIGEVLPLETQRQIPQLSTCMDQIAGAPIMALHLWFDRPISELPHAVFVGKLSQWIFARPTNETRSQGTESEYYYQVVISGCHDLLDEPRAEILSRVLAELADVRPVVKEAKLVRSRVVGDAAAVFSPRPGLDALRPKQTTPIPNLFLAGDWTATGWPATMEGAVRSGYLAAEGILRRWGLPERIIVPDLPRQGLARWLVR